MRKSEFVFVEKDELATIFTKIDEFRQKDDVECGIISYNRLYMCSLNEHFLK
jgi:hypothetical protein